MLNSEELDQAVEQFHAAMNAGHRRLYGYDGEMGESEEAIVEALLAAGWEPPGYAIVPTSAAVRAPVDVLRYELRRDSDDTLMTCLIVPFGHRWSWHPGPGFDPRYPEGYHWLVWAVPSD